MGKRAPTRWASMGLTSAIMAVGLWTGSGMVAARSAAACTPASMTLSMNLSIAQLDCGGGGGQTETRGYADGWIEDGRLYGGGYVQMSIQPITAATSGGGHINSTLWVFTNGTTKESSNQMWVEIGYTYGYHGQINPNNSTGLSYYWAYKDTTGYHDYLVSRTMDAVGTSHSFEGQEVYNGQYSVYIDNVDYGDDVNAPPWTATVQTGLEVADYSNDYGTVHSTINYDWHQVRTQGCCSWSYWPSMAGIDNSSGHTYALTNGSWYHATVTN